jgi:hypothetical protein
MNNMKWTAAALLLALAFGLGSQAMAGGLQAPTGAIMIGEKKPAIFNHAVHTAAGMACGACHHDAHHQPLTSERIAALANGAELACDNCHNLNFANAQLQKRMTLFHTSCRDCHQQGVEGRLGPNRCNDCHVSK